MNTFQEDNQNILGDSEFKPLKAVFDLMKKMKAGVFQAGFAGFESKENARGFENLNTKSKPGKLLIQKKQKISCKGLKLTHSFPYNTELFDASGNSFDFVKKGSEVLLEQDENSLSTFSIMNKSTGKYQAYVRIIGTLHGKDIYPQEGYVRAPWLDGRVNKITVVDSASEGKKKRVPHTESIYDGFYGINGKLLHPESVEYAAVDYFGKKIMPILLQNTLKDLNKNRSSIVHDVLSKKMKMHSSEKYPDYLKQLDRLKLYSDINVRYKNGENIGTHQGVLPIIQQLRNRPEWRSVIIPTASSIERKGLRKKSNNL